MTDQVGPYRLGDVLGVGSIGTVYRSSGPDGPVAVKVIHPELADEPGFRTRLLREAELARRVTGTGIVRVVDIDASSARPYLVTELLDASTLAERVRTMGPLTGESLHHFAASLAAALATVHQAGVIHRDLKPTNVLVAADSSAHVLDFGIASATAAAPGAPASLGTLGWLAPEVAAHGAATTAADVFGWGLVVAYAAIGVHPFANGVAATAQQDAIAMAIAIGQPDLSKLPEPLRAEVQAALSPSLHERPVFHSPTTPPHADDIAPTELPRRFRRRRLGKSARWRSITFGLVLVTGAIILVVQTRRPATSLVLYDDAFRNGASLNAFNGNNNPAHSSSPHQGALAISSSLSPPSAVLFIYLPDGDTVRTGRTLTFWVRSESGLAETVTVSASISTTVPAGHTVSVTAEPGRWTQHRIPLARLASDRAMFDTATERMIWFQVGVAANPLGLLLYDDISVA